ncbi:flagellar protein [Neobacillus citreus]|uniref:Flagellar protein n=1 Tax=Neobacillus citreus TaxID=2833578 RepID=A0A942SV30_9BACI|nr:flagellar protein [Neobacillus citreus]MCH6263925.1 flagellar protein [Neobacillus citreus]
MAGPQLGNCRKCGKLFLRIRDICDLCYQKQEDDYLKVTSHLRDYSSCTIQELSDATGVSVKQIREYILAQRILLRDFQNLSYPCETCGTMIQGEGKCPTCTGTLNHLLEQVDNKQEPQVTKERKSYLRVSSNRF